MLGQIIKKQLDRQGQTIAWLADKLKINEKTLAGKLNRDSITGEEILVITVILGIDIKELQKEVYKQKFEVGGNFMNAEKIVKVIEMFKFEGKSLTSKQSNYIDNYYQMDGGQIKYVYKKEQQEVYIWADQEAFQSFAESEFYLEREEAFIFIEFEDEVIWGYKEYERSLRFFEMLETIENDTEVNEEGWHTWGDEEEEKE